MRGNQDLLTTKDTKEDEGGRIAVIGKAKLTADKH
jgi:hypothetical protein